MARGALQQIKPLATEIKALPGFRGEDLDRLDLYASALVRAQTSYLGATAPPAHLVGIVEELTFFRDLLLSEVWALVKLGHLGDSEAVQDFGDRATRVGHRRSHGFRGASELRRLCRGAVHGVQRPREGRVNWVKAFS
jgi:hypothetical protein